MHRLLLYDIVSIHISSIKEAELFFEKLESRFKLRGLDRQSWASSNDSILYVFLSRSNSKWFCFLTSTADCVECRAMSATISTCFRVKLINPCLATCVLEAVTSQEMTLTHRQIIFIPVFLPS